jgi:hypothetical protein
MTIELSCNCIKVAGRIKDNIVGILWFLAVLLAMVGLLGPWTVTSIGDGEFSFDPKTGERFNTSEVLVETLYTLGNGKGDDLQEKLQRAITAAGLLLGVVLFVLYGETLGKSDSKEPNQVSIWGTFVLYLIATILALIPIGIVNENKEEFLNEDDTWKALTSGPGQVSMAILAAGGFLLSGYYLLFEGIGEQILGACRSVTKAIKPDANYILISYN